MLYAGLVHEMMASYILQIVCGKWGIQYISFQQRRIVRFVRIPKKNWINLVFMPEEKHILKNGGIS